MRTALICTDEPDPFIELADAKKQLRVTSTADDDAITAIIGAVCAWLDGGDGSLKRAIAAQTWKLVLPSFHPDRQPATFRAAVRGAPHRHPFGIQMPLPPTQDIEEIQYYDTAGVQQTLDPSAYRLIDCGTEPAFVIPASAWPAVSRRPDAVAITFVAGFDDGKIPKTIIQAANVMIRKIYDLGARSIFLTGDTVFGVASKQYSVNPQVAQILQDVSDTLLFNQRIFKS